MAAEARITINGTSLKDQESMTIRLAVDSMSPGDQAIIKLRRNGGKDATVTARF